MNINMSQFPRATNHSHPIIANCGFVCFYLPLIVKTLESVRERGFLPSYDASVKSKHKRKTTNMHRDAKTSGCPDMHWEGLHAFGRICSLDAVVTLLVVFSKSLNGVVYGFFGFEVWFGWPIRVQSCGGINRFVRTPPWRHLLPFSKSLTVCICFGLGA